MCMGLRFCGISMFLFYFLIDLYKELLLRLDLFFSREILGQNLLHLSLFNKYIQFKTTVELHILHLLESINRLLWSWGQNSLILKHVLYFMISCDPPCPRPASGQPLLSHTNLPPAPSLTEGSSGRCTDIHLCLLVEGQFKCSRCPREASLSDLEAVV